MFLFINYIKVFFFKNNNIERVINCAAYTAVDNAEKDAELPFLSEFESPFTN